MSGATVATGFVFGLGSTLLSLAGCAAQGPVRAPAAAVVPAAGPGAAAPATAALAPPTERERALAVRLAETVKHLAVDVGERNIERSWNLATATDDLAVMLEKIGFSVRRQGVKAGQDVVQNLEVRIPGGARGGEAIIIGAHFDTAAGSPGADSDASGVAAVVELARALRESKPARSLWFALFVNGEAPRFGTEQMGAITYAKDVVANGIAISGMVSFNGLGAFSTAPGSQKSTDAFVEPLPTTGDFIAVAGGARAEAFLGEFAPALGQHATLPVKRVTLVQNPTTPFAGDYWAFETVGIPGVVVTDTLGARRPEAGQKTDVPDTLDFERMARVVAGVEDALRAMSDSATQVH
jgi:hypothetical protein